MEYMKYDGTQRKLQRPQKQLPPMCRDYHQKEGCARPNCQELHLCLHFLLNRCTAKGCTKAHDLETPKNILLLERLGWRGPSDMKLALESLRRRARGHVVSVCMWYNYGCCTVTGCARLHVCYRHVLGGCPLADCVLSHGVLGGRHNAALLTAAGLADTPVSELLRRLADQLRRRPPQPVVCRTVYSRQGGCQRHCLRLHYCEAFAIGRCRYGDKCFRSHSLQDPHNQRVLRFFGWSKDQVQSTLAAGAGGSVPLPAGSQLCDGGGDNDDDGDADRSAKKRQDHGDEESEAGAETCVKMSESVGSRSSQMNRPLDVKEQLEKERQKWQQKEKEWKRNEGEWKRKEREWQEKEREQTEKQAKEREERGAKEHERREREEQARLLKAHVERERENEKLKKEAAERESASLLEENARLMEKYSDSEKTMTTIKQINAEYEQQIASLQMLLQEFERCEQQRAERHKEREEEQKKNLEELAKLREQARKTRECVECSICLGLFVVPVTLGCSHTFCRACIEHTNRANHGLYGSRRCPLCRQIAGTQVPCLALENLAKSLPDNGNQERPGIGTTPT